MREELEYHWFYFIGISCMDFIVDLAAAEDTDLMRFITAACCLKEKDSSVLYLLTRGLSTKQPDMLVASRLCKGGESAAADAIRQKKVLLAFMLLLKKDVFDLVPLEALRNSEYKEEARAVAVLYACYGPGTKKPNYAAHSYSTDAIERWKSVEGRRSRREYAIRPEAIQWGCKRSELYAKESNIEEVRTPFEALKGCEYWDAAAEELGGWSLIAENSLVKERFYELYFPDDIPDEWSREAQEKSHGRGIRLGSEEEQMKKQLSAWFRGSRALGLQSTLEAVVRETTWGMWSTLYSAHTIDYTTWNLRPVKKKLLRIGCAQEILVENKKEATSTKMSTNSVKKK